MIPPLSIWKLEHPGLKWPGDDIIKDLRLAVVLAFNEGRLNHQPCGHEYGVAHHFDYEHPLSVVFICYPHHTQFHHWLRTRWLQASNPLYTQEFHDQLLQEFHDSYRAPGLPWSETASMDLLRLGRMTRKGPRVVRTTISQVRSAILAPEWDRFPKQGECLHGLAGTTWTELINSGHVKSIVIRKGNASRGIRLVSLTSYRAYLRSLEQQQSASSLK